MSELLKKSKENLVSADLLLNRHDKWSSSIHCSYYACLQIVLHIIESDLPKYEKFKSNYLAKALPTDDKTLHYLYLRFIQEDLIRDKSTFSFGQVFSSYMFPLKGDRNSSDYTMQEVTKPKAIKCFERATTIVKDLKTVYGL